MDFSDAKPVLPANVCRREGGNAGQICNVQSADGFDFLLGYKTILA
jgi:hypothetical protein